MSPHSADRNVLCGISALQMDFISRDQLIAARILMSEAGVRAQPGQVQRSLSVVTTLAT
jgi:hypothetical protein